ncbi:MAG: arsenate reductase [Gammaproteobacteria bacterium]|jgi:arsenate reductase
MSVQIYHNPRCSKSRQTMRLLEERGITPEVIEYLKTPLTVAKIVQLTDKLGVSAHDLVRKNEADYKDLGLSKDSDSSTLLAAMASHPKLIERPIVVNGNKARLGRPPEQVLDIL